MKPISTYREYESVIQFEKAKTMEVENFFSMQYLQSKRLHFSVVGIIVDHECRLVLQNFMDNKR